MTDPHRRFGVAPLHAEPTQYNETQTTQTPGSTRPATTHQLMNYSINYDGDRLLHGIMADLGVDLLQSPYHRIGFNLDEAGIQMLSERFHDRVFRARQWFCEDKLSWTTLLLRLEGNAF